MKAYFVEFQWRPRCPPHPLVDDREEVADFAVSGNIRLADTMQSLFRSVEMLQEYHDGSLGRFQLASFGYYVKVQTKVTLAGSHVIPDHLHI